ncbi:MAG: hypothetical protein AAF989_08020 [Planctomycetota bacterium]
MMKLETSDENELREGIKHGLELVRSLAPEIKEAAELIFEVFGPLAKQLHQDRLKSASRTREVFSAYTDAGFTEEQAMLFILNSRVAFQESVAKFQEGFTKEIRKPSKS